MINMVTDDSGNTVEIAYRRSSSDEVEKVGYGTGTYRGELSVDFGDNGCMTGYRLGFAGGDASRRNLAVAQL
jgi:hypothetical protein